jgi:glutathione S-transferase
LQLPDKVLDESLDIISWATVSHLDNVHIFSKTEETLYMELVHLFDTKFKHHLDRYKYSSRYGVDPNEHQDECKIILEILDVKINPSPWIFGHQVSLLDISILPFIRQCKIANPEWFDAQQFNKVIGLLDYFEQDNLFIQAMQKYELWDPSKQNGNIFP